MSLGHSTDNSKFCSQIGDALLELGTTEAMSCMARALVVVAHRAGNDLEFTCDVGVVSVERVTVDNSVKN